MDPVIEPRDRVSFCIFRVLLFSPTIILLIQHFGVLISVHSELICSDQPIVALAGDDVILPCHLEPPISTSSERVVWTRPDLYPKYIHVHRNGRQVIDGQNPSYNSRTRLFVDQLPDGNVSLKISGVKISDTGTYFCILDSMQKEASIQLTVGAVSTPVIEVFSNNSGEVVLRCKSTGWYPEPEVSWLDAEGHVLSAGPTETVRGPDGLYTVSSRVTVEERHRNNFTCRVQQKKVNQTRETQIHVPDDLFMMPSKCALSCIIIIITVGTVVVSVCVYILNKVYPKTDQKCENEQKEEEDDGQHGVKKAMFRRKPELMKRQKVIQNDYSDLPKKQRTVKQPENQREEVVERSQTEEASGAGNNTEDQRQTALQRIIRQGGIELYGLSDQK